MTKLLAKMVRYSKRGHSEQSFEIQLVASEVEETSISSDSISQSLLTKLVHIDTDTLTYNSAFHKTKELEKAKLKA